MEEYGFYCVIVYIQQILLFPVNFANIFSGKAFLVIGVKRGRLPSLGEKTRLSILKVGGSYEGEAALLLTFHFTQGETSCYCRLSWS